MMGNALGKEEGSSIATAAVEVETTGQSHLLLQWSYRVEGRGRKQSGHYPLGNSVDHFYAGTHQSRVNHFEAGTLRFTVAESL